MIRTIIVDDEILLRVGIQSFIDGKTDISVLGVFETALEAVEFLRNNIVDIVLTDIEMAEMSGLEFIRVIREEGLAEGVIILSSHDNFSYAQEAISMGTDSYILKHTVTEEILLKEIHKIYDKIKTNPQRVVERNVMSSPEKTIAQGGTYVVGVVRTHMEEAKGYEFRQAIEDSMLVHMLEGIVQKYQMGTLFVPYNKELFIAFTYPKEAAEAEIQKMMDDNITLLTKNMRQFVNGGISYGLSAPFQDLQQMKSKYEEAIEAIEWSFYEPEETAFYWHEQKVFTESLILSTVYFMENNGMDIFENELSSYMKKANFHKMKVKVLKDRLCQAILQMMYQVMKDCNVNKDFFQKWYSDAVLVYDITHGETESRLMERVLIRVGQFKRELVKELGEDDLAQVFSYIEANLKERILLEELTDISCMSTPTFCRKFKERTGVTVVQYMNERRIEKAKHLMKNQSYSLERIAEEVGFTNANYLIRVFKKVTGQTVSDYRSQLFET